jgi:hypothetical protein
MLYNFRGIRNFAHYFWQSSVLFCALALGAHYFASTNLKSDTILLAQEGRWTLKFPILHSAHSKNIVYLSNHTVSIKYHFNDDALYRLKFQNAFTKNPLIAL